MSLIATTPTPPYYAVIFSSVRTELEQGYIEMADQMIVLAAEQPGFLGVESARNELGITVSYWQDLQSIKLWKANICHLEAQKRGRLQWYSAYKTRIAKVERDYEMDKI